MPSAVARSKKKPSQRWRGFHALLILRNAATGAAWETLHLKAAYCVRYTEVFIMGDLSSGSYRCLFTLSNPDGWTWQPGGPPDEAAIRPPAGEHGRPPVPVTAPFVRGTDGVPRLPRITGRPPFTVKGPQNGKPGLDRGEFTRQLSGQEAGLNRLTVAEFLANRDRYLTQALLTGDGRALEGDAAQKLARDIALRNKIEELLTIDGNLTRKKAREQAQQWLDTRAALHDPDQVAGGHAGIIAGMGDARVNSSIGAQWPKRITAIDAHIRKHAVGMSQQERETTFLDVALPLA